MLQVLSQNMLKTIRKDLLETARQDLRALHTYRKKSWGGGLEQPSVLIMVKIVSLYS